MKSILFAFCAFLAAGFPALSAAPETIGYVLSYNVKDTDASEGGVSRRGKDIPVKVWMELEPEDVVFVRNLKGRITLDLKGIGRHDVDAVQKRLKVDDMVRPDDSWPILTQITALLFDSDAEVPTNLYSRGDLAVPMAVGGANMIVRDKRPLWIAWSASRGPYSITLDIDGNRVAAGTQDATEFEMPIAPKVRQRFLVVITDSLGKRVRIFFRLRNKAPKMPEALRKQAALHQSEAAVTAGWLAAQGRGEWRFEAARLLRAAEPKDEANTRLLKGLATGWRPAKL